MLGDTNIIPAGRRVLHRGRKFDFEIVTLASASGQTMDREVVRHPGSVIILPLLEQAGAPPDVVLIRNWRFAVDGWLYELPAGTRDCAEAPLLCAARELEEETGYSAATIEPLCRFHTSPGLSDELMWAFVARGLKFVGQRPEPDERMTVEVMNRDRALGLISSGVLVDAKSMLTLLLAERQGVLDR